MCTTKTVNQGIDDVRLTHPLVLGYEFAAIPGSGEQGHSQSIRYNCQRAAQDAKPEREKKITSEIDSIARYD